jgi:hypothetical protein
VPQDARKARGGMRRRDRPNSADNRGLGAPCRLSRRSDSTPRGDRTAMAALHARATRGHVNPGDAGCEYPARCEVRSSKRCAALLGAAKEVRCCRDSTEACGGNVAATGGHIIRCNDCTVLLDLTPRVADPVRREQSLSFIKLSLRFRSIATSLSGNTGIITFLSKQSLSTCPLRRNVNT